MADVAAALDFLVLQVDRFGEPGRPRLPRSYRAGPLDDFEASFTYDNALVILALLAGGRVDDTERAVAVGSALLAAQGPAGFVRNSYVVSDRRLTASGSRPDDSRSPPIADPSATTGNQAWLGMAFLALAAATGERRFLDGAHRLGLWVHGTQWQPLGVAGYTGGIDARGARLPWKSTEHHCDLLGFFRLLADATEQPDWHLRAAASAEFVAQMLDVDHYCTGVAADGVTRNLSPVPLDAQTWAVLSGAGEPSILDWARRSLAAADGQFAGVSFSDASLAGVWFEGTAQLALALKLRGRQGDVDAAATLMTTVRAAQLSGTHADGRGIPAASRDGMDTGFGDELTSSLHTGATAWAVLAALGRNPFTALGG